MVSIFDQAIVSGASFLTTLILARSCTQDEVGAYWLAWTVVLFLTAAQGNLISVPYTMYCRRRSGPSLAEYAGSTVAHQLITSAVAVACFLGLALWPGLGTEFEELRLIAWVLSGAIPFILLREYARRFALAHLAMGTAVAVDAAVAVLQLAALLVLHHFKLLSAAAVYAAMGGACAVACLGWWLRKPQAIQFSRRQFTPHWRQNWSFGKWALASQLTGLAFYVLPWLLTYAHGKAETGEFGACNQLVGLSNLFVMGLNNFLMPKAAEAFTRQGVRALGKVLRMAMLCSVVVLGSLCALAFFAGDFLGGIAFGRAYADTGLLITMLAVATFTDALGLTATTGLWAVDRPAAGVVGDVVQLAVTLGVAVWLVFPLGALGIAVALVAGRSAGAAVRWISLWKLTATARRERGG